MGCDPKDVALKSLFLGPQAENAAWLAEQCNMIVDHWVDWRRSQFAADGEAISEADREAPLFLERQREVQSRLAALLRDLDSESPKFTPRFLGHMTSELALPALLAHIAVLLHNPNLTSKEVSVVTTRLEREAICCLLEILGMPESLGRGHFTSGGTMANFEAVWRSLYRLDRVTALGLRMVQHDSMTVAQFKGVGARSWEWFDEQAERLAPDALDDYSFLVLGPHRFAVEYEKITGSRYVPPIVLVPASRHFSWPKAVTLLGLGRDSLLEIPLDGNGRLSVPDFAATLSRVHAERKTVLMAVTVAGATGTGAVDPVDRIQDLLDDHRDRTGEDVWHHVDAAYGGYFCSLTRGPTGAGLSEEVYRSLQGVGRADSVTIDPHKLGFVPYSCGTILTRDERRYRCPSFDAPYLIAGNGGAWQSTLEGSRAATGAVATWMACKTVGAEGYARILQRSLAATNTLLIELARAGDEVSMAGPADLNLLCFFLARKGEALSSCNRRTEECFRNFQASPNFSVSKTELSLSDYARHACFSLVGKRIETDDDKITCLRVVLMNPFFSTQEAAVRYESLFVDELLGFCRSI